MVALMNSENKIAQRRQHNHKVQHVPRICQIWNEAKLLEILVIEEEAE